MDASGADKLILLVQTNQVPYDKSAAEYKVKDALEKGDIWQIGVDIAVNSERTTDLRCRFSFLVSRWRCDRALMMHSFFTELRSTSLGNNKTTIEASIDLLCLDITEYLHFPFWSTHSGYVTYFPFTNTSIIIQYPTNTFSINIEHTTHIRTIIFTHNWDT